MTIIILFTFFHFCMLLTVVLPATTNDHKTYIIHIDPSSKPTSFSTHESWHNSILLSLSAASANENAPTHLYSYNHVLNGFSTSISSSQIDILKQISGYVAAFPETYGTLHTTHTPKFLGLSQRSGLWPISNYGDGVIIGVIDTGVCPESTSYRDKGMAPVPARWKGKCEKGIILVMGLTHRLLLRVALFMMLVTLAAEGTMTGIAPKAHVAMYKAAFFDSSVQGTASDC